MPTWILIRASAIGQGSLRVMASPSSAHPEKVRARIIGDFRAKVGWLKEASIIAGALSVTLVVSLSNFLLVSGFTVVAPFWTGLGVGLVTSVLRAFADGVHYLAALIAGSAGSLVVRVVAYPSAPAPWLAGYLSVVDDHVGIFVLWSLRLYPSPRYDARRTAVSAEVVDRRRGVSTAAQLYGPLDGFDLSGEFRQKGYSPDFQAL